MHREGANIATAKEQRLHDKGIGGYRKTNAVEGDNGLVFKAVEHGIAQRRQENIF
jgi:hypothetical protein